MKKKQLSLLPVVTAESRALIAAEIERQLRGTGGHRYILKPNKPAKAAVWKNFLLVYKKREGSDRGENTEDCNELKYFCACYKCRKMYTYK